MDRILSAITQFLKRHDRCRVILDREDDQPYLVRYYLFLKDRKSFPFNVVLHQILKSDLDDLHDHPWPWMTIILKGGYWEYTDQPDSPQWKGPGTISKNTSEALHRLELEKDRDGKEIPCWTLFFMGPQQRQWGFIRDGKWIDNETYFAERQKFQNGSI